MAGRPKGSKNEVKSTKDKKIKEYAKFLQDNDFIVVEKDNKIKTCSMQLSPKCQKEHKEKGGRNEKEFYMTINNYLFQSKKVHICKDCIKEYCYLENGDIDLKKFKKILQLLDIPFFEKEFNSAVEDKMDTFGAYHKNIALNYLGKGWEDGEIEEFNIIQEEAVKTEQEIKKFWGKGLSDDEYDFLEEELFKLQSDFECSDVGMEMIMKDICFINLDIYRERAKSSPNQKTIRDLIEARSKLMNDGNLKPIQATGADKNEKVSFGVLLKKYENEKPIDEHIDNEMKRYIELYIPAHVAKMEGLDNELTQAYEKELGKYTINYEDIYGIDESDEE